MKNNETRTKGRWRTAVVCLVILAYLTAYIFVVAEAMELIEHWGLWLRGVLFFIFGIAWILPLGPLIKWTAKDPNSQLNNP